MEEFFTRLKVLNSDNDIYFPAEEMRKSVYRVPFCNGYLRQQKLIKSLQILIGFPKSFSYQTTESGLKKRFSLL